MHIKELPCILRVFYMIVDLGLDLTFTSVSFDPTLTFCQDLHYFKLHYYIITWRWWIPCCSLFKCFLFPNKYILRATWGEIPVLDLQQDSVVLNLKTITQIVKVKVYGKASRDSQYQLEVLPVWRIVKGCKIKKSRQTVTFYTACSIKSGQTTAFLVQ